MPRTSTVINRYPEETQTEIIATYQTDLTKSVEDVKQQYGLSTSELYRILNSHGIMRRKAHATADTKRDIAPDLADVSAPTIAPNGLNALRVLADAEGFVQSVEQVPAEKRYIWEVRFDSAVRVEAYSITDAINQVVRMPNVRRVFGALLKSTF